MKISLLVLAVLTLACGAAVSVVGAASSEFVPVSVYSKTHSPTGRLLKRSLCNTFGGCGTKRSLDGPRYSGFRIGDEASEEQRYEADSRMISEILEDIIEHLKKDQNYQLNKYVMLVPKRGAAKADAVSLQQTAAAAPLEDGARQNAPTDGIEALRIEAD